MARPHFFRRLLSVGLLAVSISGALNSGYAVAQTVRPGNPLDFTVLRGGETIGSHRIDFHRDGGTLVVDIRARIAVQILFLTVYRFELDANEVWRRGRLVSMQTKTHDDGDEHTVNAMTDAEGQLVIRADGQKATLQGSSIPASFWNAAMLETKNLFNPLIGKSLRIQIADEGEETVTVRGKPVTARHYSVSGELERELWYDAKRMLVKMSLKGKDGSLVEYVLQ